MVLENGVVSDPKEVGPYAGFIESMFAGMNLVTGMIPVPFSTKLYLT